MRRGLSRDSQPVGATSASLSGPIRAPPQCEGMAIGRRRREDYAVSGLFFLRRMTTSTASASIPSGRAGKRLKAISSG